MLNAYEARRSAPSGRVPHNPSESRQRDVTGSLPKAVSLPLSLSEPLPQFAVLTPREQDVMLCIARGMPNKIIGATLGISQRTVEAHRARIFRKLNIRNAVGLVNYVWDNCHPALARALVSD